MVFLLFYSNYAKSILRSKDFEVTSDITYEISVLKGELFSDNERTTKNIRVEADKRKFSTPNAEVACLVREKFSDKEIEDMGLYWIVTMHQPIEDSDGDPVLLSAYRNDSGSWLDASGGRSGYRWSRSGGGFSFVVSQVGP